VCQVGRIRRRIPTCGDELATSGKATMKEKEKEKSFWGAERRGLCDEQNILNYSDHASRTSMLAVKRHKGRGT